MTSLELFFSSAAVCILLMTLAWGLARRLNFFSLVDVAWAYGIGIVCIIYSIFGSGTLDRRILSAALAFTWSARLGTYLWRRLGSKFPTEDVRYEKLKDLWKPRLNYNFFWFFQFQALTQAILCLPFLLASQNSKPLFWLDYCSVLVAMVGIVGESVSDMQLSRFKKQASNKGKVCDHGLWRYSRHPNYFFEWVIWCGFSLIGLSADYGFLGVLSPLIMFLLLNYITGVPPAEQQSLLSKGDAFRNYQRRTSKFFPWFAGER